MSLLLNLNKEDAINLFDTSSGHPILIAKIGMADNQNCPSGSTKVYINADHKITILRDKVLAKERLKGS